MRLRTPCHLALAIVLAALAAWRIACVAAGPDVDTDAYAHHMIARAILADPRDLACHWVWLPLFHYAQVPLVAVGGTMDDPPRPHLGPSAALPHPPYPAVAPPSPTGSPPLPPPGPGAPA